LFWGRPRPLGGLSPAFPPRLIWGRACPSEQGTSRAGSRRSFLPGANAVPPPSRLHRRTFGENRGARRLPTHKGMPRWAKSHRRYCPSRPGAYLTHALPYKKRQRPSLRPKRALSQPNFPPSHSPAAPSSSAPRFEILVVRTADAGCKAGLMQNSESVALGFGRIHIFLGFCFGRGGG